MGFFFVLVVELTPYTPSQVYIYRLMLAGIPRQEGWPVFGLHPDRTKSTVQLDEHYSIFNCVADMFCRTYYLKKWRALPYEKDLALKRGLAIDVTMNKSPYLYPFNNPSLNLSHWVLNTTRREEMLLYLHCKKSCMIPHENASRTVTCK